MKEKPTEEAQVREILDAMRISGVITKQVKKILFDYIGGLEFRVKSFDGSLDLAIKMLERQKWYCRDCKKEIYGRGIISELCEDCYYY